MSMSTFGLAGLEGRQPGQGGQRGGHVKNILVLQAKSAKYATGISRSIYKHPSGMRCTWGFRVTLRR